MSRTSTTYRNGLPGHAQIVPTAHIKQQMAAKGITADQVINALRNPVKVTDVTRYPGQIRFCGGDVAVVVDPRDGQFVLITVYLDGVVTPLRPDQMNDPKATASARLRGITRH